QRGHESVGTSGSAGQRISVYYDIGLVSQVFYETTLSSLTAPSAIGHCRYGSHGADEWHFAQPTLGATADDATVALGMNGALTNRDEIKTLIAQRFGEIDSGEMAQDNTSDNALTTTHPHGQGDASHQEPAAGTL